MKKLAALMFVATLVCGTTGRASAAPVFLPGVSAGSGWMDVEQGFNNYCWAATSSNMLAFSGWNGGFANNAAIFANLTGHFTDVFGNPYYAVEWWFDGINAKQGQAGWPQVTSPGGNYYSQALFNSSFGWGENAAGHIPAQTWIEYDVSNDRAFTLLFGNDAGGLHWLTGWGYDDAADGAWVTDSWDGVTSLFWLPITYSVAQDRYNMTYGGQSYYLKSMESLARNVDNIPPNLGGSQLGGGQLGNGGAPEPVTLLLMGAGLVGFGFRSRRARN